MGKFNIYALSEGRYILKAANNTIGKKIVNQGFIVNDENTLQHIINQEIFMNLVPISDNVFERQAEYIKGINKNITDKLKLLSEVVKFDLIAAFSQKDLEKVTFQIMKKAKKSDQNFLLWLTYVGEYIKHNFDANYVLAKVDNYEFNYFKPLMVNGEGEVWNLGGHCKKYYFHKRRMQSISFQVFYEVTIKSTSNLGLPNNKTNQLIFLDE
jgi:hypothetical protein